MNFPKTLRRKLSPFELIVAGFLCVIFIGAIILMLPISSKAGVVTSFSDTLFTAVSAVCVTGLVVQDTATYWSAFGQVVIICLIQIGGLGVVSIASIVIMLSGKKISLLQRWTLQEAISAPQMGGIVKLTGKIFKISLAIEGAGALIMLPVFCIRYGFQGVWMSVFTSISAFCNAGFDLMGDKTGKFSSLTGFTSDPVISLTIFALILLGGIGFLTWQDMEQHKLNFKRYKMQSKVILVTSAALIGIPTVLFFLIDFKELPFVERFCASVFQAITPRTAGFNTVDFYSMTASGRAIIMMLMMVGGAPGSTAGGMKITTLAVLCGNVTTLFNGRANVCFFGRRVEDDIVKRASSIFFMYLMISLTAGLCISSIEGVELEKALFETISAMATVGLSLGLTPTLGTLSRIILMVMMFVGRVGSVTFIMAAFSHKTPANSKFPAENLMVG